VPTFNAAFQGFQQLGIAQPRQLVKSGYDHIEIPSIIPHVTRVSLLGGACLCCAKKFKAEPPQDMPKGSPFGPNLRALVIYLRLYEAHLVKRGVKRESNHHTTSFFL